MRSATILHTPCLNLMLPCRSLANGMVIGTSEGFTKELSLIGVGYRGAVSGQKLTMNLGYSHPVEMDIPQGITVQVDFVPSGVQAVRVARLPVLSACRTECTLQLIDPIKGPLQKCMETECTLTNPTWVFACHGGLAAPCQST